jgi:hypothetical protein
MEQKHLYRINTAVFLCLIIMISVWGTQTSLFSQELSGRFLTFIPEGTIFRLDNYHKWGIGPGATFNFKITDRLGGQLSFSALLKSLDDHELRAFILDAGVWKPIKVNNKTLLAIGGGGTFFRRDYSEPHWLTGFAVNITGHAYFWFFKSVGLYFRPAARLWLYRGVYFKGASNAFNVSLSAGLAFRI